MRRVWWVVAGIIAYRLVGLSTVVAVMMLVALVT